MGTRLLILMLAGIGSLVFFGSSIAETEPLSGGPKTVRVGAYENPPKIFSNESGVVSGFWADLVQEIAGLENWEIEYVSGSWSEGLERLVAGEIDIMLDVAFTEPRAKRFSFSTAPVLMSWARLYIHEDNDSFQSIHDLEGRRVAALRGSVNLEGPSGFREMVQKFNLDVTLVELSDYHEVFQAIQNGVVDAGITNRNFGNKNAERYQVKKTPIIFQPINLKFAFPPNFPSESPIVEAINRHMREFQQKDDSIYYRLLAEYFESEIAEKRVEVLPGYLARVLAGIGGLLLVLGMILLVSRIQVRRQTRRILLQNEELQASEQEYREILNSPSDVIFIHDADTGLILDINNAVRDVYGYEPEEVPQLEYRALSVDEPPFTFELAVARMKKAIDEGPQVFEWKARKKSGEVFWVEVALKYSKIRGKGRIIAVVRDIHERKWIAEELAAEQERLSVTLRSIGDAVITTDLEGRVVLVNKVAEGLTGWPQSEAVGRPLTEVFPIENGDTGLPLESPFQKVMATGSVVGLDDNTILISRTGQRLTVADSGAPIRNRDSQIVGMVLVFRDVTDQIRMEEEILKVKKLESIGILAGGIAHDFNNILAAIMGNLNLVAQIDGPESESAPLLDAADKAVQRAEKLTNQLLTFSKGGDPVKEAASAPRIIEESADFVLRGSSVACNYRFDEGLWLLEADTGQISQVIQNLVLNARDAMPEGGTIEIAGSNCSEDSLPNLLDRGLTEFVKISIQDTGIGMPNKLLDKIFDPFFSTKKQGSGLGLAITQSIITKHGGHIFVESEPGHGTRFTLYLPAAHSREGSALVEEESLPKLGGAKILVMDDEEMLRKVFRSMLSHLDHEVVLAREGEEAIRVYREHHEAGQPFDLVVLDLTVPGGMGGAEAGRVILEDFSEARIIVASGYSNDPIIANFRDYGFSGAMTKPLKLSDLGRVIDLVRRQ